MEVVTALNPSKMPREPVIHQEIPPHELQPGQYVYVQQLFYGPLQASYPIESCTREAVTQELDADGATKLLPCKILRGVIRTHNNEILIQDEETALYVPVNPFRVIVRESRFVCASLMRFIEQHVLYAADIV